ncbi:MAG: alpha-glucan family phosphorylase [Candidatus Margulisiibacteriota bacterium]
MVSRAKAAAANTFKERVYNMAQRRPRQNVAFFSMEYALANKFRIYSGGLGVLAGDWVKSAADIGAPVFPIGLLYRDGYFKQQIVDGRQRQERQSWDIERGTGLVDLQEAVSLQIAGQTITAKLWGMEIKGYGGEFVPLTLLDTRGVPNPHGFEEITSQLYAAGQWERLTQEMVLGIGGVRALELFGLPISYYHLNEGHAAFAIVEVLNRLGKALENITPEDFQGVKELFSFTTHTPVPAGFDRFEIGQITHAFSEQFLRTAVLALGKDPQNQSFINMALLAMRLSGVRNGVSQLHAQVSEEMFPEFRPIIGITNGIHHLTWTSENVQQVLDEHVPDWKKDPAQLSALMIKRDDPGVREALWSAHQANKARLINMVKRMVGVQMDPEVLTVGFARRFATYKRGNLLFTNEAELRRLADEHGGLQIIMSGKAHPADGPGKGIIAHVIEVGNRLMRETDGKIKFAFIPDYDMSKAAVLVSGADIWLNNPLRPYEASGTSGMKASINGVPNVSISDGWWAETRGGGWTIGDPALKPSDNDPQLYNADSASLYQTLGTVLQAYRNRGADPTFVNQMIEAIALNGSFFNTQRMTEQYVAEVWRPRISDPLLLPKQEERASLSLGDTFKLFGRTALAVAEAPTEAKIEELAATALLKALPGSWRVTRYDAHNESVRIARGWIGKRFGEIVYEERRSELGQSGFDHWKALAEFSGEVMADLLRTKEAQIIAYPEKDRRCYRDGKLSAPEPFILVPEIVNGEIRGAYKIDFRNGGLLVEESGQMLINSLLEIVGSAKAKRLEVDMAADFAEFDNEAAVINWALVLATAGGFVDMPRYAIETNRVAIFVPNEKGELVGAQAIGETSTSEHHRKLTDLSRNTYTAGVQQFLRKFDQGQSALNLAISGKPVGKNIVYGPIKVQDGFTMFNHLEFNGGFDTVRLRELREQIEQLLAVDGRKIENYLLLPVKGADGKLQAMVYVDNAFSGKPLNADKFMEIIDAAAQRIIELRAAAKAAAQ